MSETPPYFLLVLFDQVGQRRVDGIYFDCKAAAYAAKAEMEAAATDEVGVKCLVLRSYPEES